MQAIEAAVHRWDAENALGAAGPLDAALAVDAIGQTLEFLVPMRRAMAQAPPGEGGAVRLPARDSSLLERYFVLVPPL